MFYFLTLLFSVALFAEYNPATLDLEEWAQDFVLESKEIQIPGYPLSFNPAIIQWQDKLLFFFRTHDPVTQSTDGMGVVWVDEDFNPISIPQILDIPFENRNFPSKKQEPRPLAIGDHLYLIFNNTISPSAFPEIRRMYICEIFYDGRYFSVSSPECFTHFPGEMEMRPEKNWVPFEDDGTLFLSQSISPHRVMQPIFGTGACLLAYETSPNVVWDWGVLRGGSPALLVDGEYLAFFHSCINFPSIYSKGKKTLHYMMGAYTFSADPPYTLTRISPEPIVGKNFYHGRNDYTLWKPLHVVFPGGFIYDDDYIWVVYGRQDHELWVVKLDKRKFMSSLVSVG